MQAIFFIFFCPGKDLDKTPLGHGSPISLLGDTCEKRNEARADLLYCLSKLG